MGRLVILLRKVCAGAILAWLALGMAAAQVSPQAATARHWVPLHGQASDLALTPSGNAWALDGAGRVWLQPKAAPGAAANMSWSKQPGEFRQLRATHDGVVWGIDERGMLYRLDGSLWRPSRDGVRDVAASPDGIAWVLSGDGKLVRLADGMPFLPEPSAAKGQPQALLADEHGLPWLIFADGTALRFDGLGWRPAAAPEDQLRYIAIGLDGTTLAINNAGRLLRRQPDSGRWFPYDGAGNIPPARQVAVAADGLPWIVSSSGQVFAERPLDETNVAVPRPPALFTRLLSWRQMGVNARQVSVSGDGTVFSIAPDGTAWRWKSQTNWAPLNGKFRMLVAGDNGRGWGLDDNNRLRQFDNGLWRELPATAVMIAAGPKNSLWGIQPDGSLAKWDEAAQRWQAAAALPVRAQALAIGANGEPWLVDETGNVMMQQAGKWVPVRGIAARSLGIGPDGTVYATTQEEAIYWLDRREMEWKPATGKARQIAVGPGGTPWAVTAGGQLLASGAFLAERAAQEEAVRVAEATRNPPPPVLTIVAPAPSQTKALSYQTLAGNLLFRDVGIGGNGAVFAAGGDGGLYCFSNPDTRFNLASTGNNQRVTVTPGGALWVVSSKGVVSYFENRQWVSVPEFIAKDIASGPDGQVWAAGIDGQSYRYNTATARFGIVAVAQADKSFKARRVAGGNGGILWVVTEDSQLMRCEKGVCKLALSAASDAAVAPDNTLFVLDGLGKLQRYDGKKKAFVAVNGQGISLAVGPQGLPWLVNTSGQIQYAGLIYPGSKTVNTANCAQQFAAAQTPVAPASASIKATDDVATLLAGGSIDLLANDSFNGHLPTLAEVTLSLEAGGGGLTLSDSTLIVPSTASSGSILNATYKLCPRQAYGTCASAQVRITVTSMLSAPGVPTGVSAVAGNTQATVSFSAPASNGGSAITSYTATSNPGGFTASGAASPLTVSGLTNGTNYTFTVTATNAIGTSTASTASAGVTPSASVPGAPTGVSAVAGDTQATVSFSAPASNGGSAITGYTVTSSPGGLTVGGAASPIIVSGLNNGTAYTFTVTATNVVGTGAASAASSAVTPQGVPGMPTGVSAVAGNTQATVSFSAPASNGGSAITSYTATSNPGGFTASGAASPLTVSGLTNGTSYTFTVTATNAIGTSTASTASVGVTPSASVPGAPTGVSAVAGDTQATVSFSAPASNGGSAITGYTVTSSPGGFTVGGAASPIIVSGLNNGTAYTFTVTATNVVGTGVASTASSAVTPQGVPGMPTGVSAVAGNTQATVSFSAPASNGGSVITSYTATSNPGGFTASGAASPLTVSGLTNGTSYTFTVAATNALGTGVASTASSAVTPQGVPGAPTGVSAVAGDTQATVSFSAPASDGGSAITGYTVTSSPGGFTASGAASPLTVNGLTNGTSYTFTVTATNAIGTGSASTASAAVTPATLPGAPTSVVATSSSTTSASVSFVPPASNGGAAITSYTVTSSPGGITASGAASPINVTGLTTSFGIFPSIPYTFTVTATNSAGNGAPSAASNAVTPGVPTAPTSVTAVAAGPGSITVSFAPGDLGGVGLNFHVVNCMPVGFTNIGSSSPVTVTGLTTGVSYTCDVYTENALGALGPTSAASNAVVAP